MVKFGWKFLEILKNWQFFIGFKIRIFDQKNNKIVAKINENMFQIYLNWKEWTVTGNTKGGSITVPLTSCLTGLD